MPLSEIEEELQDLGFEKWKVAAHRESVLSFGRSHPGGEACDRAKALDRVAGELRLGDEILKPFELLLVPSHHHHVIDDLAHQIYGPLDHRRSEKLKKSFL